MIIKTRHIASFIFCINALIALSAVKFYFGNGFLIRLPVKYEKKQDGTRVEMLFNDGGTRMFKIIDSDGKLFEIYIDHRISFETNWGVIYLNGYPDSSNCIRVEYQKEFSNLILKNLK